MMLAKLILSSALLALGPSAAALELPLAGARFNLPVVSLKAARFHQTYKQHYDFSCGSAALATLLTYHYGHPVSEQQVFHEMYQRGEQEKIRKHGFSLLDMQRFLASRGFRADGFQLPLEKLAHAALPAMVLIAENGYRHFVVLKGMRDGRILLGDPSRGMRAMPIADFRRVWVGGLLFVIHGFGRASVRFNDAKDWRAAPSAPLADSFPRDGLHHLALPRNGPGDF